MMAVDPGTSGPALRRLAKTLPKPRAIVVVSAHFETRGELHVTSSPRPETLHDFYGFPDALYKLQYPAPGDPNIASELVRLLQRGGLRAREDPKRPLDHGCWVPLLYMYPEADIPVVQVSLPYAGGPSEVAKVGAALAELRNEGVLLIGSGSITHNLGELDRSSFHTKTKSTARAEGRYAWASEFRDWIVDRIIAEDDKALLNYRSLAPHAQLAHPRDEHLLPIFFARAAGGSAFHVEHTDYVHGSLGMDIYTFA